MNQITEEFQAKDSRMAKYLERARAMSVKFRDFVIRQIPRLENTNADALAKLASAYEMDLPRTVPVEMLHAPSISETKNCEVRARARC